MAAPLITAITTVPNRENATNQASFSNDTDTFFREVNDFQNEANAQAQYLDGVAAQVDADAATALSAKNSAVAAANYRGDWTVSSDVKQGESYSYSGKEWIAKQDSVGVTPVDGAFWLEGFGDAVNVRYDNTSSGFVANDVQGAIDEAAAGKNIAFKYAVSQLVNGDPSKVVFIDAGVNVALYDYFIFQSDGRIYKNDGGITGTLAGAFNPATGGDPGISGNLTNIYKINADQIFGLDQTWTSFVSPDRQPGVLYTNNTKKVRWVSIYVLASASSASLRIDGVDRCVVPSNVNGMLLAPILPNQEYQTTGTVSVNSWSEIL